MDLHGQRAFVTGATGFLGGYLVEALLARGAHVTALVRRPESAVGKALAAKGVTLVPGDVTDLLTLEARGADVFFHNAAVVGHGLPKRLRARMFEVNVEGTRNALAAARRAGIRRFVHTSSIAAIGDTRGEVADEQFARNPWFRSAYEQSKLEAHLLVMGANDLDVVLPMPGVILGPGSPLDPLFHRFARKGLPLIPGGDGPTGFVHVKEVAEGMCLAAEKGTGPYLLVEENLVMAELFESLARAWDRRPPRGRIGMGPLMATATLAQGLFNLVGKAPPLSREHVVSLKAAMRYSSEKARRELGWRPRMWEHLREEREFYASGQTGLARRS